MQTSLRTADGPSLLLTLVAPFHRWEEALYLEDQAISGLKAWAEHFSQTVAGSFGLLTHAAAAGVVLAQRKRFDGFSDRTDRTAQRI